VYLKCFDCDEFLINKLPTVLSMGVPASAMKTQETGSFKMLVTPYRAKQLTNLYMD
jgi:hypothetical protein